MGQTKMIDMKKCIILCYFYINIVIAKQFKETRKPTCGSCGSIKKCFDIKMHD
jgi:hypothetical protein